MTSKELSIFRWLNSPFKKLAPEVNKIYVANYGSDSVTVINGTNNSTTTVAAGTDPYAVAVNPITNRIYVANNGSNNVTVIDGRRRPGRR
ncbi:MAG: hypothetical protein M3388_16275 [Acidobacteriota bacterium]|nr:hypothetical protein [Acidobacteriota bacterium]